jgi:hypothetical protein
MVNDIVIPLSDFTQTFLGNVLRGMALSLGSGGKGVGFNIDVNELTLYSDDTNIQIKDESTRLMIVSTVRGMLSSIKGVVWMERVTLTTRE